MEQTTILGKPVWFKVCSQNDCHAQLIGPFFSPEEAEEDAKTAVCDNAHFIIPKAIEWMQINTAPVWIIRSDVLNWVDEHNEKAVCHPNFSIRTEAGAFQTHSVSREPNGCIEDEWQLEHILSLA